MNAHIITNAVPVTHTVRPDVGNEYLTVPVPNGWDDVRPLVAKVLLFDGREFTFTGWNSDSNQAYFVRPLNPPTPAHAIIK